MAQAVPPIAGRHLPLYGQTAARIAEDLRSAGADAGDRLPSERALSERYAVSRVTVRAALKELEEQRVVLASASRGWFVGEGFDAAAGQPRWNSATRLHAPGGPRVLGFADFAARHGLSIRARVLSHEVRSASLQESERLRVAPGASLFDLVRVRSLDDLVVVIERNRLPLSLCPSLADADFARASLYATLRDADPPQLPTMAEYSLEARRAAPRECELLEMDPEIPLLVAEQLAFNQDGRPLEWTVATYRGDRYRFSASLAGT